MLIRPAVPAGLAGVTPLAGSRLRASARLDADVDVDVSRAQTFYGSLGYTVVRPHEHRWQSVDPDTGAVINEGTASALIMRRQLR